MTRANHQGGGIWLWTLAGILISFWQLLHPYLALSCLDSVLLLDQAGLGQDSEAGSAQTSFTLNKLSVVVMHHPEDSLVVFIILMNEYN